MRGFVLPLTVSPFGLSQGTDFVLVLKVYEPIDVLEGAEGMT
jgi:hypothetical protein